MQNQTTKTEFYKNMARFLELLIWFLFVSLIILSVIFYNWYSHKNYSRYQVFLPDVDGIIVGSPVRMLGVQVGYVKHLKLVNDMVYVDLIINKKDIEIPKGSKLTIEFSGLGGSRSIEVYVPKEKYESFSPSLVVQTPRRLRESVSLLYQMFKKIGDIIYRCTYFSESLEFDKLKKIEQADTKNDDSYILNDINMWLDKQNSRK